MLAIILQYIDKEFSKIKKERRPKVYLKSWHLIMGFRQAGHKAEQLQLFMK